MKFTKMHGCGNDYIYINGFEETIDYPKDLAVKMADRHFGIGGDGIVLILPSDESDFRMRMFNADGSEAEMCGNAIRCVGKYVYEHKMTKKEIINIETMAGIKILDMAIEDGLVTTVRVDMGEPILLAKAIPVLPEVVNTELKAPRLEINVEDERFVFTCVSMGNPHTITFVDEITDRQIHTYGPEIEVNNNFPEKTNVEFAQIINRQTIDMRVWERGTGETLACGTGACATMVAAVVNGKVGREAIIRLLGGELYIEWDEKTNHVFMTGPAEMVFTGEWKQ
jgi:diaminopimelate epimerase